MPDFKLGEDVVGRLNKETGELRISGTGSMYGYEITEKNPLFMNENIKKISFDDGITEIGANTFSELPFLESIEFSKSINKIDEFAFMYCPKLKEVFIPETITKMGLQPFQALNKVKIDENNKYYDSRNDCNCIIDKPNNYLLVGSNNAKIPSDVIAIGNYAFEHCKNIETIEIPDSVCFISDFAFYGCSNLKSITLGKNIYHIGTEAFLDCDKNLIIRCEKNSITERTLKYNGYNYKYIDDKAKSKSKPKQYVR